MSYFKDNKLKFFHILLVAMAYIVIGLTYSHFPVEIKFHYATTANCFLCYTDGNARSKNIIKSVKIKSKTEAKIFLPTNAKNLAIYVDSKAPCNIDYIKIDKTKVPLNLVIKDPKHNPIISMPKFEQLMIKRQKSVFSIMLTTLFLFLLYIALLIDKELMAWYIKAKNKILNQIEHYISEKKINKILNILKYLFIFGLIFIFSFTFFNPISFGIGSGLDNSWMYGLNKLNTLPQYIYGRDVVFTYGPLGFLLSPLPLGNNLYWGMFFDVLKWVILIGFMTFNVFKINPNFYLGKIIFLLLGIFVFYTPSGEWIYELFFLFLILTLYFFEPKNKFFVSLISCLIGFFSILICLIKFNMGLLAIVLSLLLGLTLFIYERKYFKSFISAFAATFVATFAVLFLIYFKNVHNLINWVIGSMSIAQGFNSYMTIIGPLNYTLLAVSIIFFYCTLLCYFYKLNCKIFIGALLLSPFIFFAFKHGFVRQDGHMENFFYTIPYIIGFLSLYIKREHYKKFIKIYLIIVACCLIYPIQVHYDRTKLNPFKELSKIKLNNESPSINNINKNEILPMAWNKEINNKSIQILPIELSYVEANNLKGWQPNFGLQLYSVCTKYLDDLSAKTFVSENAPDYILLEFMAIDNRNMFLDNPATWNNVMNNYTVDLSDKGNLLLKKNKSVTNVKYKKAASLKTTFDNWIKIPESNNHDYLYAKFDINKNLLGKATTLVFKGYPIDVEIKYTNGNIKRYRAIIDTLKNPTIINYIPNDLSEFEQMLRHTKPKEIKVKEIRFITTTPNLYENKINIEWMEKS